MIAKWHAYTPRILPHTPRVKNIGIIGSGNVGSCIASSIIHRNIAQNIYMDDINKEYCKGVVLDLEDEAFITGTNILPVKHREQLSGCDIVIITAGAKQEPNEPRSDLISRNAIVLHDIIEKLAPEQNPNTRVILVTNPVDVLTHIVQEWTDGYWQRNQIIGSGTYLDTQRTRVALAKHIGVSAKNVHAYVLGEHGDSQVFAKSISHVAGQPLISCHNMTDAVIDKIAKETKQKAYEIIKRKGSTSHGIGECVASICESIVLDKKEVMPVSCWHPEYDTCLGWPAIIGNNGIVDLLKLELSEDEKRAVMTSGDAVKRFVYSTLMTNVGK